MAKRFTPNTSDAVCRRELSVRDHATLHHVLPMYVYFTIASISQGAGRADRKLQLNDLAVL